MHRARSRAASVRVGEIREGALDRVAGEHLHQDQGIPQAVAPPLLLPQDLQYIIRMEEFLQAIWPETVVSEAALTVCLREIRLALGDEARAPQFIATVHRRGYRFIARVQGAEASVRDREQPAWRSLASFSPIGVVGREATVKCLQGWFERALRGERQVGFVMGEAGVGKTTLVETFLDQVVYGGELWVARGQCLEHYGVGEAYLPVLEVLGRLARGPGGERMVEVLGRYAPTWLLQLPALLSAAELEALQRRVVGATRERMLRELVDAVEALTVERPLVVVLEDLHWSDYATLDLIAYLARRREAARLLLIGTYRPIEVVVRGHPLKTVKQELEVHGQCEELALELLTEAEVTQYLAERFGGSEGRTRLGQTIYRRTDGLPLFMVTVVEQLVRQGALVEVGGQWEVKDGEKAIDTGVPESLRQMIAQQLEQLSPEAQRVLEAASVAGMTFAVAAVAAGLEEEVEAVEECCARLALRGQFLEGCGVEAWSDGTLAACYSFRHALYQQVLYDQLPIQRQSRLHRQIGEREEAGRGEQARERAAALAVHFERGRDGWRAVRYRQHAAENALHRWAYREATDHLTRGLDVLQTLPESPERTRQELELHMLLGRVLMTTKGYASPETEHVYARARELCEQVGEAPQLFAVLWGLWNAYASAGALQRARELAEQLVTLAQQVQDLACTVEAHRALGQTLLYLGELALARAHLEQSIACHDHRQHRSEVLRYGQSPGIGSFAFGALAMWLLGYPDQALRWSEEGLALAQDLAHPLGWSFALTWVAWAHQFRGEAPAAQGRAEAATTLATEYEFSQRAAQAAILWGWALAEQGQIAEGIAQVRDGLAAHRGTGAQLGRTYNLALLAEGYGKGGQIDSGLNVIAEALAVEHQTGERWWEAELHRLKGELLLQSDVQGPTPSVKRMALGISARVREAEACFEQALAVARRQEAKSLELRAAMSLARLWQHQRKKQAARELLAEIYGWFTEGFDSTDLREARALLEELGGAR